MSEKAFSKTWSFFAAFALSFGVLCWLRVTGVDVKADEFGFLGRPARQAPILCIPVLAAMMVFSCWTSRLYGDAYGSANWATRFPIFLFEKVDVNVTSREGRRYQGWALFLFFIVPVLCLLVLFGAFLSAPIFCDKPEGQIFEQVRFVVTETKCASFYRYAAQSGPQYYPQYYLWATPWLYSAIVAVASLYAARTVYDIVKPRRGDVAAIT